MNPSYLLKYLVAFLSLIWYLLVYYYIDRNEFLFFISGIVFLGISYWYWVVKQSFGVKEILVLSALFRLVLLFSTPNLSDDYYRFYWDGMVSNSGVNPYEYTPTQFLDKYVAEENVEVHKVYSRLNSQDYYSVYPPVNQLFFRSAEFLAQGNLNGTVFILKIFILVIDMGLIALLFLFLKKLRLAQSMAMLYALNPLVVLELTGNLHFEGVMMFFVLVSLYFVWKNNMLIAGIAMALAISTKVIPLILLPLFLPFLGLKKSALLYFWLAVFSALFILPMLTAQMIDNFGESVNLYFQTFEFNASIYYLAKEISYALFGFKSPWVGVLLPIFTILGIISVVIAAYFNRKRMSPFVFDTLGFMKYAGLIFTVYYLFATTVHPWYIINILVFCVFVPVRAFVIWSLVIFVSYFAYSEYVSNFAVNQDFNSYWVYYFLIGIEYLLVVFIFIFDTFNKKIFIK